MRNENQCIHDPGLDSKLEVLQKAIKDITETGGKNDLWTMN